MRAPKTFEEGLQRLQELLAKMQDETTTLDQSVKRYAEDAQLKRSTHRWHSPARMSEPAG